MEPSAEGARIRRTAIFDRVELGAEVYWYGLCTIHEFVFAGALRGVARKAFRNSTAHTPPTLKRGH